MIKSKDKIQKRVKGISKGIIFFVKYSTPRPARLDPRGLRAPRSSPREQGSHQQLCEERSVFCLLLVLLLFIPQQQQEYPAHFLEYHGGPKHVFCVLSRAGRLVYSKNSFNKHQNGEKMKENITAETDGQYPK